MITNWLETYFDGIDFSAVFYVATFFAVVLSLYLMQATWYAPESVDDPWFVAHLRHWSYAFMALMGLWLIGYAHDKMWHPWPPFAGLLIAMDFLLLSRAIAISLHWRQGPIVRVGLLAKWSLTNKHRA